MFLTLNFPHLCFFPFRSRIPKTGPAPPGTAVVSILPGGTQHVVHMPSSSIASPHGHGHPFPHGVSPTPVAVVAPMPAHSHASVQMPSQG